MLSIYRYLIVVNIHEGENHVEMIHRKSINLHTMYLHELDTDRFSIGVLYLLHTFQDVGLEFDLAS